MASRDSKIVRRAQAMTELARLSGLLAEHLNIETPKIDAANKDAELAEIQRIENINGMLASLIESVKATTETDSKSASKKIVKHGPVK